MTADEAFATGTFAGVMPISQINKKKTYNQKRKFNF